MEYIQLPRESVGTSRIVLTAPLGRNRLVGGMHPPDAARTRWTSPRLRANTCPQPTPTDGRVSLSAVPRFSAEVGDDATAPHRCCASAGRSCANPPPSLPHTALAPSGPWLPFPGGCGLRRRLRWGTLPSRPPACPRARLPARPAHSALKDCWQLRLRQRRRRRPGAAASGGNGLPRVPPVPPVAPVSAAAGAARGWWAADEQHPPLAGRVRGG